MANNKIYLMLKVRVNFEQVDEFNKIWGKQALPVWEQHGAKHIGTFRNYVGDTINEMIRLFEFNNILDFHKWQEWTENTEEGQNLKKGHSGPIITLERKLLTSVY